MRRIPHCEPAASLFEKLGGLTVVSGIVQKSPSAVQRWRWPKEAGGTGGNVPHWHHPTLLAYASENGINLGPEDFLALEAAE